MFASSSVKNRARNENIDHDTDLPIASFYLIRVNLYPVTSIPPDEDALTFVDIGIC